MTLPSIKAILDWSKAVRYDRFGEDIIIVQHGKQWAYFSLECDHKFHLVMESSRNLSQE